MHAKTFSGELNDGRGVVLLARPTPSHPSPPSVLGHGVMPADFQPFCSVVLNEINLSSALAVEEQNKGNLCGCSNAWVGSQRWMQDLTDSVTLRVEHNLWVFLKGHSRFFECR